jgi:hypothetical protein
VRKQREIHGNIQEEKGKYKVPQWAIHGRYGKIHGTNQEIQENTGKSRIRDPRKIQENRDIRER